MKTTKYIQNILIASPLYFVTVVPFILLATYLDLEINVGYALLGALGWWIALVLRLPVLVVVKATNLNAQTGRTVAIGISGPAEESVRLVLLLVLGMTSEYAFSIAIGWAAIEIIYSIIQNMAMGILDQRTDEKAREAKTILKQQGMEKSLELSASFWGVLERISANALHLSFSLLLVVSPLFILLTAPLHSYFNFMVVRLIKNSIARAELALAACSLTLFTVAVVVTKF